MSASLVQQQHTGQCFCNCTSHKHTSLGVGLPLINLPFHHGGATTVASAAHGLNQFSSSSISSENHVFSSSSAISTSSCNSCSHGIDGIVEPVVYPYRGGHVKHTHASYRRESIPELNPPAPAPISAPTHAGNGHAHTDAGKVQTPVAAAPPAKGVGSWTLSVPIPVPHGLPNATLETLAYTIRYASLGAGSASVQTDVVLSHGGAKSAEGIVTDYAKLPLYSHYGYGTGDEKSGRGKGYGPPMLNEALGLCLASVPAFKGVGNVSGWSHYLDHQKIYPNVRIGDDHNYAAHAAHSATDICHIYLFFHVYEYPDTETLRSISVDVSATWNDGAELKKLKEEKAREVNEIRLERERLIITKREAEEVIRRLEATTKKANEESERRRKGEAAIEKELRDREVEFISIERKAKDAYEQRLREEQARLKTMHEAEQKSRAEHEKRMHEEEARFRALSEAEKKAELEHQKRMREEAERFKAITDAESRVKEEYAKRTREEEARLKVISEAERKAEVEHTRRMKEEDERLKMISEAESRAKEEYVQRLREQETKFKAIDEAERKARVEYERRTREEEIRLKAIDEAESHAEEEYVKRSREEQSRLKELEELQRTLREERELLTRQQAEEAERRAKEEYELEMKRREEAARKEREENERRAKEEAERRVREAEYKAREEAERRAREAEHKAREEAERKAREEDERKAREEVERERKAEAERKAKEAAEKARVIPPIAEAPHVADEKMQEHIAEIAARLGQKCKNGYAWEKKAHGYKCSGGGHFISFKDLGMQ